MSNIICTFVKKLNIFVVRKKHFLSLIGVSYNQFLRNIILK